MIRLSLLSLAIGACSASVSAPPTPKATIERTTPEGLATVVLSEANEAALGVALDEVTPATGASRITVGGEVMVPAGREITLSAPVGARVTGLMPLPGAAVKRGQLLLTLVPLASVDRDVRARAQRDLDIAQADFELAQARLARAETMMNERSGSTRTFEDARAQQHIAQASLSAAQNRLQTLAAGSLDADVSLAVHSPADGVVRSVRVAVGQSVPSGAPLVEIASSGRWVRVSLSSGDALRSGSRAWARRLEGHPNAVELATLQGPPSADPLRATVDRFFALPPEEQWPPGERLIVELEAGEATTASRSTVAFESIVRDAEGGTWLYVQRKPHHYRRTRVEVSHRDGERMVLMGGPPTGTKVVAAGAVELWGFELGADR